MPRQTKPHDIPDGIYRRVLSDLPILRKEYGPCFDDREIILTECFLTMMRPLHEDLNNIYLDKIDLDNIDLKYW